MSEALDILRQALDRAAEEGRQRLFWWRDDDAVEIGPRLLRLVDLAGRTGAPLSLAVIPARATDGLLALCESAGLAVLQHGVCHANHETAGKSAELGGAREAGVVVEECVAARERLAGCRKFLPVMVPPWNRMRGDLPEALAEAGFRGVSLFGGGPATEPLRRVDTHLDPVAWRGDRSLLPPDALAAAVLRGLATGGPVGLLTHHAMHDGALDAFVGDVVSLVSAHPGAAWREAAALFPPDDAPRA